MTDQHKKQISKFLSLILRHQPEKIGLKLNENGWVAIQDILENSNLRFTFEELEEVVRTNDKGRFSLNENKTMIRANQGHSLKTVDLGLKPKTPPEFLYHGTVGKSIPKIKQHGLKKMKRQYVHLSTDKDTATKVGARRGKPIVITVRALDMQNEGHQFYISENGVWLTNHVPPEFINF